jgi:hypothetical protein
MDAPERYEQLIAFLSSNLPAPVEQQPVGDDIIFTGGAPPEVVVHLTHSAVSVAEYAGTWDTPDAFIVRPRRVGVVKWRRLPETPLLNALAQLIKGARETRLARYRTCQYCGQSTPPEWLYDDDVCQGCAEQARGMVH